MCDTQKYVHANIHTHKEEKDIDCRGYCFSQPGLVWISHLLERLPYICFGDGFNSILCGSGLSVNYGIPVSLAPCMVQHDTGLANQRISFLYTDTGTGLDK